MLTKILWSKRLSSFRSSNKSWISSKVSSRQ